MSTPMTPEDRVTCTSEKKLKSMLPKIIKIGYEALNLINFFTFGPKEVRDFSVVCAHTHQMQPGPVNHFSVLNFATNCWSLSCFTGSRVDHSQEFKSARGRGRHSF